MRISDWSADVCSSDLLDEPLGERRLARACGTGDQDVEPALHRQLEKFDVPSRMKQAEQFFLDGADPLCGDLRFREQAAGLEIGHRHCLGRRLAHGDRHGAIGHDGWKDELDPLAGWKDRSEEHTSELQSLMRISYAVFCLKK